MRKTTNSGVLVDIRIAFLGRVADCIVNQMGTGTIELGDPEIRKQFARWLKEALRISLLSEEQGTEAVTKKVVAHFLRITRDPEFMDLWLMCADLLQKQRANKPEHKKVADQTAGIERWERRRLNVSKMIQ